MSSRVLQRISRLRRSPWINVKCHFLFSLFRLFNEELPFLLGDMWKEVAALPNQMEIEQSPTLVVHESLHLLHGMADSDSERAVKQCAEGYLELQVLNLMHDDQLLGEDQSAGDSQGVIEAKEELALEFPWVELDVQTHEFSSTLFQVSHPLLELPVYINLHIPFGCPHESMETNTRVSNFLGCMSYTDIKGSCRILTVTYRCVHLRNQVLVVLELFESSNLIPSHDLAAKSPHLFQGQFQMPKQSLISEVSKGTGGAHAGAIHDCLGLSSAKFLGEQFQFFELKRSSKGMHFSIASQDKCREWYRGRKIWFKTNISWQPWLLLWLSLLHMLNSSTGVLSLQQCSSSGGVLDLYDDVTLLTWGTLHACTLLLTWRSSYKP